MWLKLKQGLIQSLNRNRQRTNRTNSSISSVPRRAPSITPTKCFPLCIGCFDSNPEMSFTSLFSCVIHSYTMHTPTEWFACSTLKFFSHLEKESLRSLIFLKFFKFEKVPVCKRRTHVVWFILNQDTLKPV